MKQEKLPLREEAEVCRRRAHAYVGLPEAIFLMNAAEVFDDLAAAAEGSSPFDVSLKTAEGV